MEREEGGCCGVASAQGLGGQERAGWRVPVGLLAFVVVCRLLVVGDGLGRHGAGGGQSGTNAAFVTCRPGPAWDRASAPRPFPGAQTTEDSSEWTGQRGAPVPEDWPLQPSLPTPARQGLIATDLLNVHQLRLVDLSDGDVVLGCDRESALGGIWEGVGCDQCPAPVPEAGAPSPSATPVR